MKLYEIEQSLNGLHLALEKWAEEHEGDITDFPYSDYEDILNHEKETKLLNIACWIKGLNAEAEAIKAEEQNLAKRRKVLENKSESLKGLIKQYYSNKDEKLSDSRAVLSYRRSEKVVVDNEDKLPEEYWKIERKAKLTEIKNNIDKLEGIAHLQENWNLQIK